jgi:hypothetical protein
MFCRDLEDCAVELGDFNFDGGARVPVEDVGQANRLQNITRSDPRVVCLIRKPKREDTLFLKKTSWSEYRHAQPCLIRTFKLVS